MSCQPKNSPDHRHWTGVEVRSLAFPLVNQLVNDVFCHDNVSLLRVSSSPKASFIQHRNYTRDISRCQDTLCEDKCGPRWSWIVAKSRTRLSDDYHQCVRYYRPSLHPASGPARLSLPGLSAPDYQCRGRRPRGPGAAPGAAGEPSITRGTG